MTLTERTYAMPPDLQTYVLPTDRFLAGTLASSDPIFDSRCQWDDAIHVDDMRPVVVVVTGKPYGEVLGRMCAAHYRAVLEGRSLT